MQDDKNFYGKYGKIILKDRDPYPSCDWNDDLDLHKLFTAKQEKEELVLWYALI